MSDICIVAARDGSERRAQAILDRLAREGQKSTLLTAVPGLSIGHCDHFRLRTRRAPAPMTDGLIVAIEGDIFDENGVDPDPQQLIADIYRQDALERVANLNGSFNVAILDPVKRRIVVASDRFGTRPLYVWHGADGFAATSRLDALLADGRPSGRLSLQGLVEIVALQRPLGDQTLYEDVFSLIGSEIVTWENGHLSRLQTWQPAWGAADFGVEEAAERLAAGLRRAVSIRLTDAERPGLLLSGGLDSRLVLAAATAENKTIECITAVARENRELRIARDAAARAEQPFHSYEVDPEVLAKSYDSAAVAVDGLYPAPINLFSLWPRLAASNDVLLHGYGLDYTLRGLYLPKRKFLGASWPFLRPVADGGADTVAANMTVGDRGASWRRAIPAKAVSEWTGRLRHGIARVIASCAPRSHYDAWDTLCIAPQSRHYTSSALIGMGLYIDQRLVSFDRSLADLYMTMRPEWRAGDVLARRALRLLSPALAAARNANSNLPASLAAPCQVALIVGRAMLRRLAFRRDSRKTSVLTEGSWVNHAALFRSDSALRARLKRLAASATILGTGVFCPEGLTQIVEEHLSGRGNHAKFLHSLASLDAWFQHHPHRGLA